MYVTEKKVYLYDCFYYDKEYAWPELKRVAPEWLIAEIMSEPRQIAYADGKLYYVSEWEGEISMIPVGTYIVIEEQGIWPYSAEEFNKKYRLATEREIAEYERN